MWGLRCVVPGQTDSTARLPRGGSRGTARGNITAGRKCAQRRAGEKAQCIASAHRGGRCYATVGAVLQVAVLVSRPDGLLGLANADTSTIPHLFGDAGVGLQKGVGYE